MAAACLFLAAKVEEQPRKLEHVIKVSNICQSKETNIDTKSEVSVLYMIDSDQRLDSNRHPLLKSASIDVIILNHNPIYGYSQIGVLSKYSDLWRFID